MLTLSEWQANVLVTVPVDGYDDGHWLVIKSRPGYDGNSNNVTAGVIFLEYFQYLKHFPSF